MLTPDQVRLRLEQAMHTHHEESCWLVLDLLHEILPELVVRQESRTRGAAMSAMDRHAIEKLTDA